MHSRWAFVFCLVLAFQAPCQGSDLARERRIAEQIEDAILVGEPVQLTAGSVSFLAIHTPAATDTTRGAAILLHGMGANPDWIDVIHPLRSELPEGGWDTLSLQMPIAASDGQAKEYYALIPEAGPRIDAALAFLLEKRIFNVVLIGHSLGSRMGAEYLAGRAQRQIQAFVAVGLSAPKKQSGNDTLAALGKITLPVLDIYGSQDLDSVLDSAHARTAASRRAKNADYLQIKIEGANHFFHGLDETLIARVRKWMNKVVAGTEMDLTR